MNQRPIQILFALLRSAICGTKLTEKERNNYSPNLLQALLKISSKHDVEHLLALGLRQNALVSKENTEIKKCILKAAYRYERIRCEYENLCTALEKAKIPFLPLKGAVIRKYYPEAWMRTSCDIDVLVHERDCEKAKSILISDYGYVFHRKGPHDISLYTQNNIHVELHYDLVEAGRAQASSNILLDVWKTSAVLENKAYQHYMTDEMFYFYHIAHMAKHFEAGGCGMRPFIDLWILDGIEEKDQNKRNELLKRGGLLRFSENARHLSEVWLNGAEHTEITEQMEYYILRGGVYGTDENRITVQQQKKGGRMKYALSKIFIPYDDMKFLYPVLQKHRWLTPFMEVRRWIKLIFCGHAKRVWKELKYNQTISADKTKAAKKFLEDVGL